MVPRSKRKTLRDGSQRTPVTAWLSADLSSSLQKQVRSAV